MSSAFNVMIQMSIFANKIDQKVASNIVTLKDKPAAYSIANRTFDDEGHPVGETTIIDQGILKTYLHNTSTAKLFKTKTTGNAGLVAPMAWNIEMDVGDVCRDDMFNDLKRGLYLTNTWYTRFQNYATGDFSTLPRDGMFLIENGEIQQSFKDIRLSDNALKILSNIAEVSKERQHIHWWEDADPPSLCPYVLVRDVQMTKPT
jgi:PmbA protein